MKRILTIVILLLGTFVCAQNTTVNSIIFNDRTTTERDAYSKTANKVRLIYNETTGQWEYVVGTGSWVALSTIGSGTYLPLAGGTMTGDIDFNGDNTINIGDFTNALSSIYSHNIYPQSTSAENLDWRISPNVSGSHLAFAVETTQSTQAYTERYRLNQSGTPSNDADLTDKGFTDATYLALSGGTLTGALTTQNITPSAHNTYNLGADATRWAAIYGHAGDFTDAVTVDAYLSLPGTSHLRMGPTDTEPPGTEGNFYADNSENRLKYHDGASFKALLAEGDVTTNATHTGDVTGAAALTIEDDKVLERHLKAVNSATDEQVLTYESTTGDFEWQDQNAGGDVYKHPNSPVQIDSIYVGTVAQIAAASLGSDVLAFPTDAGNDLNDIDDVTETSITTDDFLQWNGSAWVNVPKEEVSEKKFIVPLAAVGGDVATGTGINFVPIHDAITITRVEASVLTAGTTSVITFDINEDDGTPATILSTKLTIDATERFSDTAATPAVISDASIAAGGFLIIDIDTADSGNTGADPTVTIYYTID